MEIKNKSVIREIENLEIDILYKIINNKNFLSNFAHIENNNEDLINYLLIKNEDNDLALKVHKYVISTILVYYFSNYLNQNFENFENYFDCLNQKNNLNSVYSKYKIEDKLRDLNKEEIIHVIEFLHVSFLNSQIQYKSGKLTKSKSKVNLRERGSVYTKDIIAKKITEKTIKNQLDNGLNKEELRILDFGCATGRFYLNAFDYLVNNLKLDEKEIIKENLYGIDIDSTSIDILKIKILNKLINPTINDLKSLSENIICKNMLIDKKESLLNNAINFKDDFNKPINNGGFNVILSNPPYFLLKINKKGKNKLFKEHYKNQKNKIKGELNYFRNSGHYDYAISGMLNYYKLSIERMIKISSNDAEIGVICPSTLFADLSSKKIRKWMLINYNLREIEYFPESENLFNQVAQSTVIFYLSKTGKTNEILVNINNETFNISLNLIKETFGDNYEIAYINKTGWDILNKLSDFKKIKDYEIIRNKRGELDLTQHKNYITTKNTGWRLVRGNMIQLEGIKDINNEYVEVEDFLTNKSEDYKNNDFGKKRLVCQQISNIDISKRLNFTICDSKDILGNSCNYIYFDENLINGNIDVLLKRLKDILNSYLLNWRFKITSSNNHINNYEIDELPLLKIDKIPDFKNKTYLEKNIIICKLFNLNKNETIYILKNFYELNDIESKWVEN